MKKPYYLLLILLFICNLSAIAQIKVYYPAERMIVQRDNNNQGTISVSGIVEVECDRVEARLVSREGTSGGPTSWLAMDKNPGSYVFSGEIKHIGGWYKLEIRAFLNGNLVSSGQVERVGIGEVFVIAGQSNAQGFGEAPNANGSYDDRVNTFKPNYFQYNIPNTYKNLPDLFSDWSFAKIDRDTDVGPGGYTAWCYGELGDLLVAKLNVPVLFFNAAYSGTSSRNWIESALGYYTKFQYSNAYFDLGYPYKSLKVTLQNVNSLLGLRGILWHQGEFDGEANVSTQEYVKNITDLFNITRKDVGVDLPIVVARVSRYYGKLNNDIITAQNQIIANVKNVWAGPETDNIQVNRYDGGHFQNSPVSMGLTDLAQKWNEHLSEAFFRESQPALAKPLFKVDYECLWTGEVKLNTNEEFTSFVWNDGNTSATRNVGNGIFTLYGKDAAGNLRRSITINTGHVKPKIRPNIDTPMGLKGCNGKTLDLKVDPKSYTVEWSNGVKGDLLRISNAGNFSARYINDKGCASDFGSNVSVQFIAPAQKPVLSTLNNVTTLCEADTIQVNVTNIQNSEIIWSTGESGNGLVLTQNLDVPVYAVLYNLPDCPSEPSNSLQYRFYDKPKTPEAYKYGPFYLRAETIDNSVNYTWRLNGNVLNPNVYNDSYIKIYDSGKYTVQTSKEYSIGLDRKLTCLSSISEEVESLDINSASGFSIFPNPNIDGKFYITSEMERTNVRVSLIDELGREIYNTQFANLSVPRTIDLKSYNLVGKYYLILKYDQQSKTFPLVFVK